MQEINNIQNIQMKISTLSDVKTSKILNDNHP